MKLLQEERQENSISVMKEIASRWSPNTFADRAIEKEKLISILEAALLAPSSYNEQPWRFIIARREDERSFNKMLDVLLPGNAKWAKNAPVLMLTIAAKKFKRNDKLNRHAWHDVGLASQNMAIQATHEGVAMHFMGGFDAEKAVEQFKIPEDFSPVAAAALGYYPDSESNEAIERSRRPLGETVFTGVFGKSAELVN